MKKSSPFSYFILFVLMFNVPVLALSQDFSKNTILQNNSNKNSVLNDGITLLQETKNFVDENKNLYFYDDYLLQNLLKIPYDKRQYFFPFIHEETLISHKIKSHPQIIVWKGKKPTVIAPVMQEFAKKHLDDLPAVFYYFLDPDYWETPQPTEKSFMLHSVFTNTPQTQARSAIEIADYAVRSLRESHQLPAEIEKNYNKTSLTISDIQRTQATLNTLTSFIKSMKDPDLPSELRSFIIDKVPEAVANPFEHWVQSIQKTKFKDAFEQFIQKQGWQNAQEFAVKSDIILRSVRVNRMSLIEAIGFSQLRKENPIQKDKPLTSTQMYFSMYEATPGDAIFVAPYADELRKIYHQHDFIYIGLPIYID